MNRIFSTVTLSASALTGLALTLLAAATVAGLMLVPSAPAAAAGKQTSVAARATVYANPNRIIRDHRRDPRCKWTGRFHCALKQPPL